MSRREPESPFQRQRVPGPPDSLERRVFHAAAAALRAEPEATIWDRLWNSRALRVAWSIATLALLLAHVAVSRGSERPAPRSARVDPPSELREILTLPTIDISSRAESLAMGRHPDAPDKNEVPL